MKRYLIALFVFAIIFGAIFTFYNINQSSVEPIISVAPTSTATSSTAKNKNFSATQVATHNSVSNCWTIISGKVYNITSFIPIHPGGSVIIKICGKDGTSFFKNMPIHEEQNAAATLGKYYIGEFD